MSVAEARDIAAAVAASLASPSNELILPDASMDDEDDWRGVVSSPRDGQGQGQGQGLAGAGTVGRVISSLAQSVQALPLSLSSSSFNVTEGEISARISTRTFVFKDWAQIYWVISERQLFLYRNRLDFKYNPSGTQIKKRILLDKRKIRLQPLKSKEYDNGGRKEVMFNFMVDEEHDFGNEHLVKFASTNLQQVQGLYQAIRKNFF
jgi:hypothetical protein